MNMFLVALICVGVAIQESAATSSNSIAWREFKRQHGKVYGPEEDAMRLANFLATKQRVERHNANSSSSYKMGFNHLSDWSEEEYKRMTGPNQAHDYKRAWRSKRYTRLSASLAKLAERPAADEVDWRKVPERVGEVRDQGHCCSGWAFASAGIIEGQMVELNFSKLIQLSVQEFVDCSVGSKGCDYGTMVYALEDIRRAGGIEREKDYKYEAVQGQCRVNDSKILMVPKENDLLPYDDEPLLKQVIANYGPVGAALDATDNLRNYKSGVLDDPDCDTDAFNHCVLLVGYGQDENGLHYWIAKNSWGSDWGDNGYFKIRRGVNMCGIAGGPTATEFHW